MVIVGDKKDEFEILLIVPPSLIHSIMLLSSYNHPWYLLPVWILLIFDHTYALICVQLLDRPT